MHADGKSTLASVSKWNSGKVNCLQANDYLKLQLHYAIYRLRFYSNSLIHILSLSNLHNNVASIQKNRADKSHRVIVALGWGQTDKHCWSNMTSQLIIQRCRGGGGGGGLSNCPTCGVK